MRKICSIVFAVMLIILISQIVISIPEIVVNETELVKLQLQTQDKDSDELIYSFSEPLNENGEWQTDYGDAGEYLVDVTVSDGAASTTQTIKIKVLAKNRPPAIEPINDVTASEGDTIIVEPIINDYENDKIKINISEPIGNDGRWETDYESSGVYDINVIANDGNNEVYESFALTIEDVNRPPFIESYEPLSDMEINEMDKLIFRITAKELDEDDAEYEWLLDGEEVSNNNTWIYQPDYDSEGMHQIKGSVNDNELASAIYWNVSVKNTNRAPVLKNISEINANELDLIKIRPYATDADGDNITYNISVPFDSKGEWQTGYDDAGEHIITITASDGKAIDSKNVKIILNNVDRAPIFGGNITDVEMNEGDTLDFTISLIDPDGDKINLSAEGLPEGAKLTGNKIVYKPDYITIRKKDNWVNSALQTLHLDWLYPDKKVFNVMLTAQSNELSAKKKIKIELFDSNRAPDLQKINDIKIKETDTLILKPNATDFDFDRLKTSISGPVGNDGRWETDYNDEGIYNVTVKVSDGELEDSQTLKVAVENNNRGPVFENIPNIIVNENEEAVISLKKKVSDPDGDEIELSAENLPEGAIFSNGSIRWKTDYNIVNKKTDSFFNKIWSMNSYLNKAFSPDKKNFTIKLVASDKKAIVEKEVTIYVKNVNRLPRINATNPPYKAIVAFKNQPVAFDVKAYDLDGDNLEYRWKTDGKVVEGVSGITKTFKESGIQKVVLEISDGLNTKEIVWKVRVK